MKLLRLKADGFGMLRAELTFDPERMTLVVDENERGKSTLIAAILAALYGLENDRRSHKLLTPLDRWRPWDGGSYKVELELEWEGQRCTVKRDFDRGLVEVWNDRGQEITAEFRDGKDQFPVGRKMIGLDVEEFEKCALVRQGELDRVVPDEERTRRNSTLAARLESAADTKVGDTNASDALRVLDAAARRYNSPEVDTTVTVDNAIQRLETRRGFLEAELKSLEHQYGQISGPLGELAGLEDEERKTKTRLAELDALRREALSADLKRQLAQHREQVAEIERLRLQARGLSGAAHVAPDAESQFSDSIARFEEAQAGLEALEARRRDEMRQRREVIEREIAALRAYESCAAAEADLCVSLAAEIRRVTQEDSRLRDEIFTARESLAGRGHDPERLQWLRQRFGTVPDHDQQMLRKQSEATLVHQAEVAALERERNNHSEVLREIDAQRSSRLIPGGVLLAVGLAALVGGGATLALRGPGPLGMVLAALGVGLLVAGVATLMLGSKVRDQERIDAFEGLSEAQRKLAGLRAQRAETEAGLARLARGMGYREQVELLREWNEYARLVDESGPALRAQEHLSALDGRRRQATEQARTLLERVGGGAPEPGTLEKVAAAIRRLVALRQALAELGNSESTLDEDRRVAEATVAGYKERALRILQSAGLGYDPARSWSDHGRELSERLRGRQRHATLVDELIPQAEARLLSPLAVAELEGQLARIEAAQPGTPSGEPAPARAPLEVEDEHRRCHEQLLALEKRRSDLRVQIEEVWRRYHAEHPEKLATKDRVDQALFRARRFKHSIELARETIQKVATETHRRWADYLNQRVGELLESIGSRVQQVRFGDDLDFSVRLADGQQLPRGRAELQLSSGARDQLYLAVRLAVSEFLSRGQGPLPMVLDDVFITSDDERTRATMRVLLERFSRDHQIVLFTCHRARFEAFSAADHELYAERAQWITLGSPSVVS